MIYFLSPFYNEEEFLDKFINDLGKTANKISPKNYKIFLVNDGSQDQSLKIALSFKKKYPITIISYKRNKGVDFAFKEGFRKIFKTVKRQDIIATLESDNTSDLSILKELIQKIRGGTDVALASCYAKGGGVYGTGIYRQVGSKVFNYIFYLIFPIKGVKTYSSFYRSYNATNLKKAWGAYEGKLIDIKGFACMVEMLIKLSKLPLNIEEVPMVLRWEGRQGKSKMRIGKTVLGYWSIVKELFLKEKFGSNGIVERARKKFQEKK